MKKELEKQIRLIEDQINKIEEIFGNYPPEEIQLKLNWLYTELNQLEFTNTMKNIKHGIKEIKVTSKIYGSYSIRNKNLLIYKGSQSNIFYLTYSNVVIMIGKDATTLLDNFDEYINTVGGLDNQLRAITDNVNQPLYRVFTKDDETISIYKVLKASDSLELLETSETHGGKYAIYNKKINGYLFGLSYDAAIYTFNNK